jgi:hypothetical protein
MRMVLCVRWNDMAINFSRAISTLFLMLPLLLAACSTRTEWVRADGRTDDGLAQLKEIDTAECKGDTAAKEDSDVPRSSRQKTDGSKFADCMVAQGYSKKD